MKQRHVSIGKTKQVIPLTMKLLFVQKLNGKKNLWEFKKYKNSVGIQQEVIFWEGNTARGAGGEGFVREKFDRGIHQLEFTRMNIRDIQQITFTRMKYFADEFFLFYLMQFFFDKL